MSDDVTNSRNASEIVVLPGQEPAASPAARWIGIITGIAFLAVGFAAAREIWLRYFDPSLDSWAKPLTSWVGNLSFTPALLVAGIISAVVGVILFVVVFLPRNKTHRRLVDDTNNIWMRPVDIARMASAAAESVPGVRSASTTLRSRQVLVDIDGDESDQTLPARVGQAVGPLIAQLEDAPQLLVKIESPKEVLS